MPSKMLPRSLKNTLLLAVALLVTVTAVAVSQIVVHRYSLSVLDGAAAHAENIAHKMALDAADKVLINDLVALQKMLDDQIASDDAVAYLFVVRSGRVLAHSFSNGMPFHLVAANHAAGIESGRTEKIVSQDGDRYIDVAYPIFGGMAGILRLGLSEAPYRSEVRRLWVQMSVITLCILALSLAAVHWMIGRLTRPLHQLTQYAGQIHAGNLSSQVAVQGRQEVTQLAAAFNAMLARIADYTLRLKSSNEQLERRNKALDRVQKQLKTSLSISRQIAALSKLDQICRCLIQALKEIVPCSDMCLLVFNTASRTVNLATPFHTQHLAPESYERLGDISRYDRLTFLGRPELGRLQLPGSLNTAEQAALFPIRLHEEPVGALLVACGGNCECVRQELDVVVMLLQQVAGAIHRANSYEEEMRELRQRIETHSGFGQIIGKNPKMQVVFKLIEDVAPTDTTVLILGESGTGKELVARAIHQGSHRADKPFVVINCAAYPATLLESELFGHEKGAFTGALRRKAGRFEQADGGTVFLDEIGDIDPMTQTKLLRVLQQKVIDRLGGDKPLQIDVRILAATNKNLIEEVRRGNFREDLYYRLNVIPIHLPPLRERRGDIHLLAHYFLERFCREQHKKITGFANQALRRIMESDWPGNVRELENTIEHAVVLAKGSRIELNDLPSSLVEKDPAATPDIAAPSSTIFASEAQLIQETLSACGWNKAQAARRLGIGRSTLYEKIKKLKIVDPTAH